MNKYEINKINCGELGIRTLGTLLAYTHFPGVPLQPLEQLSFGRHKSCQLLFKNKIYFYMYIIIICNWLISCSKHC